MASSGDIPNSLYLQAFTKIAGSLNAIANDPQTLDMIVNNIDIVALINSETKKLKENSISSKKDPIKEKINEVNDSEAKPIEVKNVETKKSQKTFAEIIKNNKQMNAPIVTHNYVKQVTKNQEQEPYEDYSD